MTVKIAATFQNKYRGDEVGPTHSVFPEIRNHHFMIFEGDTYRQAHEELTDLLGQDWSFAYVYEEDGVLDSDFQRQIKQYGLTEFVSEQVEFIPPNGRRSSMRHNHVTRDIKSEGECPGCDEYHDKHGNYLESEAGDNTITAAQAEYLQNEEITMSTTQIEITQNSLHITDTTGDTRIV